MVRRAGPGSDEGGLRFLRRVAPVGHVVPSLHPRHPLIISSSIRSTPGTYTFCVCTLSSSIATCSLCTLSLHALKKLYPKHSVVMTGDYRLSILSYPGVIKIPVKTAPLISNLVFIPLARSASSRPGLIADFVELGAFHLAWEVRVIRRSWCRR